MVLRRDLSLQLYVCLYKVVCVHGPTEISNMAYSAMSRHRQPTSSIFHSNNSKFYLTYLQASSSCILLPNCLKTLHDILKAVIFYYTYKGEGKRNYRIICPVLPLFSRCFTQSVKTSPLQSNTHFSDVLSGLFPAQGHVSFLRNTIMGLLFHCHKLSDCLPKHSYFIQFLGVECLGPDHDHESCHFSQPRFSA